MVIGSDGALFVNSDGRLNLVKLDASGVPSFDTLNESVGGVGVVNGLAMLSGTRVAGGGGPGIGKLFAFDVMSGTLGNHDAGNAWPSATTLNSPTSGPAVGQLGIYAQYRQSGQPVMLRVNPSSGTVLAQSAPLSSGGVNGTFSASGAPTPTLGAGDLLYAVDDRGRLFVLPQAFAANSNATWAVALPAALNSPVVASPALDCNRRRSNSESGVIYIATENGWLVSYIIDSKGLDPMAPWPKYARDARNTGNFNGPAIGCP